ncbi:hypothetical protein HK103_001484 [Boothiomyces macroporosus]|uniref:Bola-like protein n=1 Tax=Boothiomyces macroporosus TaxID=261099 RepID=A0AAD5ULY4_9FUNG|nr:hypothetical protein HK103_001484 [Boothiomyces macroporosus]
MIRKFSILKRLYTNIAPLNPQYTLGEKIIHEKLATALEAPKLNVKDISGGCGSMYAVEIHSPKFKGKNLVTQHRMVSDVIKDEIKEMHGIQIKTHVHE